MLEVGENGDNTTTGESPAFAKASDALPSSQHESSLLSSLPHVAYLLHSSTMRGRIGKVVVIAAFPLTTAKIVL